MNGALEFVVQKDLAKFEIILRLPELVVIRELVLAVDGIEFAGLGDERRAAVLVVFGRGSLFGFMLELARNVRIVVRLLGKLEIVQFGVLTPQMFDEVERHVVAGVVGDHAYHEYAIRFEIDLQKMVESFFAYFGRLVYERYAARHPLVGFVRQRTTDPFDELHYVPNEHERIPKPNHGKYLLIEQVYGQHTLNRVFVRFVRISHFSYEKITQCYLLK